MLPTSLGPTLSNFISGYVHIELYDKALVVDIAYYLALLCSLQIIVNGMIGCILKYKQTRCLVSSTAETGNCLFLIMRYYFAFMISTIIYYT